MVVVYSFQAHFLICEMGLLTNNICFGIWEVKEPVRGQRSGDKNGKERQPMNGELSPSYHYGRLKLNPAGGIV